MGCRSLGHYGSMLTTTGTGTLGFALELSDGCRASNIGYQ